MALKIELHTSSFLVVAPNEAHYLPYRLRSLAVLADNATPILGANIDPIEHAALVYLALHLHRFRVAHQSFKNNL